MFMKITTKMIVSNSDMIKNYKDCRNKAEELGKIFILKNNRPDAVLLSIDEYENLSAVIEYLENFEKEEIERITESLKQASK
jgi:prevent-host-death family protein